MRLSAYKKAIDEAKELPANIPEYKRYFSNDYSPREEAIRQIMLDARLDHKGLFAGEYVELYKYTTND